MSNVHRPTALAEQIRTHAIKCCKSDWQLSRQLLPSTACSLEAINFAAVLRDVSPETLYESRRPCII